ncbi:MAG: deoxyribonuclease IV [Thermoplasmata archaeon]
MGLLGAHVSVQGGVDLAPERARDLGCDAMQIFTRNQMQWKARVIDDDEAARFRENLAKFKIRKTMAHDSYLINLASPDKKLLAMSVDAFKDEMDRASRLSIDYLVFHPGAHMGAGENKGMRLISENIRKIIEQFDSPRPRVLFESTAGQGSNVGYSFEQLAQMLDWVGMDDRTGVCFDTCHSYAAGYDIATEDGYEKTFELFDDIVGIRRLFAFHINDSKGGQGSKLDRHENIGKGKLGKKAFAPLVNDPRFAEHPMVLETPGGDDWYRKDLKLLRSLMRPSRR